LRGRRRGDGCVPSEFEITFTWAVRRQSGDRVGSGGGDVDTVIENSASVNINFVRIVETITRAQHDIFRSSIFKEVNYFFVDNQEPFVDLFVGRSGVANLDAVVYALETVMGISFGTTVSNRFKRTVIGSQYQSLLATALRIDFESLGDGTSRDRNYNVHTSRKTGTRGGTNGNIVILLGFSAEDNLVRIFTVGNSVSGDEGVGSFIGALARSTES